MSARPDPKELIPAVHGFLIGIVIMAVLVGISLALGQTPSIWFGVPYQ